MKFVYALALLIASVTVFGANAQRRGIENELEELDLLISLSQNDYALDGLVSTVRDALQRVVERVKAKLADNKELLEQFRAKIEEVQEKIRDLVKQGGAKIQQAVQQIREKLQSLVKAVFDKLNQQGSFYEAEQEEKTLLQRIVERLRQLAQEGLNRLKERLAKYKDVFEQVKDKVAEIQEKLTNLGKDFGVKAVEKIAELRQKLRALIDDVKQRIADRIKGSEYALHEVIDEQDIADYYEGESLLQLVVQRLRQLAENALATLKEKIEQAKEVSEEIKGIWKEKISALQRQIDQLRKATTEQAIRIFQQIREAVAAVLEQIKSKISGIVSYESEVTEEKPDSLIRRVINRVRDLAQRALDKLKERLAPHKETLDKLKAKITEVQQKIVELGKAAGAKAVEVIKALRLRLRELAQQVKDALKGSSYAADDEEEDDETNPSLINRLVDRIRRLVEVTVNKIQDRLATQKELLAEFKDKIDEVNAALLEVGKKTGKKALDAVRALRRKVQDLNKAILDRLTGKGAFYEADELVDDEEEEDNTKTRLFTRIAQRVRAIVEKVLSVVKSKLAQSKELAAEFKEKLDEVTAQLAEIAKKTGKKALDAIRELREKVKELNKEVINRIKEVVTGSLYEAEEEEEDKSIKDLIGESIRAIIERISAKVRELVEQAKEKIGQGKEVLGDLKERVDKLTAQLKELSKQSLRQALQSLSQIREKIYEVLREIKQRITGNVGALYDAEREDEQSIKDIIGQKIREIIEKVKAKVQELVEQAKEKIGQGKELLGDLKERIDQLTSELKELSKKSLRQALQSVAQIREKVYALLKEIKQRITGQASFYEVEDEIEEPLKETAVQRIIQRVRAVAQKVIERVKDLLSKRKDIFEKVKAKLAEVTQQLAALAKEHGQKAIAAAKALRQKIRDLVKDIASRVAGEYSSNYDLRDIVVQLRDRLVNAAGVQLLKGYLNRLQSNNPYIALVRSYVESTSDDDLLDLLEELFSGLQYLHLADANTELIELGRQLKAELLTDAGIQRLKDYAKSIDSLNPIVQRIKIALETRPTANIKAFIAELLSGIPSEDYAAPPADLKSLVQQVKDQLLTDDGLGKLRTYAKTILPRHPLAILVRSYVLESNDNELRELINELIQVSYYDGATYVDLRTSLKNIKNYILSEEGIQTLKDYFGNLETSHPVVLRLKALVEQASNDVILIVATEILGNI